MIHHFVTTPEHKKLPMKQITTKLNAKNAYRIQELRKWFENQGVSLNQQQIIDDLLTHAFNSATIALKINDKPFSYAEIIEPFDKVYESNRLAYKNGIEDIAKDGYEWLLNLMQESDEDVDDFDQVKNAFDTHYSELFEYSKNNVIDSLGYNEYFEKLSEKSEDLIESCVEDAFIEIEKKIEALKEDE